VAEAAHWNDVYAARPSEQLGWYEPVPATLDLVLDHSDVGDPVVDVGGGDSRLVDQLVAAGYRDLTVLDLSEVALERARARLTSAPVEVVVVVADVTTWSPPRTWALWHDRAVFHFLVDAEDRAAYQRAAAAALAPGGRLIVATFGLDGPERCAGRPVRRYDVDELADALAPRFRPIELGPLRPRDTAVGDQRPYIGGVFERAESDPER
jgi:SAM-dependent methyltransferase